MEVSRCRICFTKIPTGRIVLLFGSKSKESYITMLSEILRSPIIRGDGLPEQICHSCSKKVVLAHSKVVSIHRQVEETTQLIKTKRTKDSSGPGVSPDTAKQLPPPKRILTRRQLNFEAATDCQSTGKVNTIMPGVWCNVHVDLQHPLAIIQQRWHTGKHYLLLQVHYTDSL